MASASRRSRDASPLGATVASRSLVSAASKTTPIRSKHSSARARCFMAPPRSPAAAGLLGKRVEVLRGNRLELGPPSEVVASAHQRVRAVHHLVWREAARYLERMLGVHEAVGELARDLHQEDRVPEQREGLLGPL